MIYPQSRRWVKCYPDSPYPKNGKNGLLHHRHPWSKPGQGHPKVPKVRLGICSNPESSHPFDPSFPWDELKLAFFFMAPGVSNHAMKCTCNRMLDYEIVATPCNTYSCESHAILWPVGLAPRLLVQAAFWGIYLQGGTQKKSVLFQPSTDLFVMI